MRLRTSKKSPRPGTDLKVVFGRNIWIDVLILAISHFGVVTRAQAASACGPAAEVQGNGPAIAAVVSDLERRGITTYPVAECPAVRARIQSKVDGIVVTIVDTEGRTSERTANGVTAAATLIESWARTDVVAPLLAPRPERLVLTGAQALTTASPTPRAALTVASRRLVTGPVPALSLTASGETSLATDGSVWFGVSVGVCFRIGRACAGSRARVSNDLGFSGGSRDRHTGRLATDVLLGAGLPIRRGRLIFMPAMSIGVGWMRTTALASSNSGDTIDVDSGGLRASGTILVSFNVTTNIALSFGIDADLSPLAHTAPYDGQATLLAGEPLGYLRGGLGIRIGVP